MKSIVYLLFILSMVVNNINCQLSTISLSSDYCTFKGDDTHTYVEIYISFFQNNLSYQEEDSLMVAHFSHTIEILQKDSIINKESKRYKNSISSNETKNTNLPFIDVFAYYLQPGSYTLIASIFDEVSKKNGKQTLEMIIPPYDTTFNMSDVQLSTKIEKAETKNRYSMKNNITIYPKPSRIFDMYNPVLFFYFEAYNLNIDNNNNNKYTYHYFISDKNGEIVRDYPISGRTTSISTIAEIKGINIISLKSDSYYLNIELTDSLSGNKTSCKKLFHLKKSHLIQEKAELAYQTQTINEYQNYTEEELKKEFDKLKYIARSDEKKIFKQLDQEGMKNFLVKFWKERDPDPTTPVNELKNQYNENIQIANNRFSGSFREGWETDRGRVLLLYGRPDEIERHPSSLSTKPYEIWYYYSLEGGCEFIFADLANFGDYLLLHSTYRNEIKDYNWKSRVIEAGSSSDF